MPPETPPATDPTSLLTKEELEGFNDTSFVDAGADELVDHAANADKALEETKLPPPAEDPAKPADTAQPAPAADPALAPAPAADPAAPPSAPAPAAEDPPPAPRAPQPARDFTAEIGALEKQQDALAEKADNGDITMAEYNRQNRELQRQIRGLEDDRLTHRMRAEDAAGSWLTNHVGPFLSAHPQFRDGPLNTALDQAVRQRQDAALAAGEDQFNPKFLEEAYAEIAAAFGAPAGQQQPQPRTAPAGATGLAAGDRQIPPNMNNVPNAGGADDLGAAGRWAAMDRLADSDPEAYEQAMAKMSEADRQAYLRA